MKLAKFALTPTIVAIGVSLFVALSAQATDYTWTGDGDDALWTNPANWGKTAEGAYPQKNDKPIFPADADVTVVLTDDLNIFNIQFNAGCSVKLVGAKPDGSVPQLKVTNGFTDSGVKKLTLDHLYFYRNSDWTPKAGCSIELTNEAQLYLGSLTMTAMDSVSLSGGSTMSVNAFSINGKTRSLTIDDSTFEARSSATLGTANPGGGHIVFKGAHPIFRVLSGECRSYNNAGMTDMFDFDFEVPTGGFDEIPVQIYGNMLGNGQGRLPAGYFRFNVLEGSAAKDTDLEFCALFSAKGVVQSKVSTTTETIAALHASDDTAGDATSDAVARLIWFKFAGETPAPVPVHPAALVQTSLTTVNRHKIAVRGWLSALPTNGDTVQLELWAGESNNPGEMELIDTCEEVPFGAAELTFAAPEDIGEKAYYFQLRLVGGSGGECVTPVVSATTKDVTVYTWTDKDGDWTGDWTDSDHWTTDYKSAYAYPQTANATAKFPRGHEIVVTVDADVTVGTADFTDYNPDDETDVLNVTLTGDKKLTATTFNVTGFGGTTTLDGGVAVKATNAIDVGLKRTFAVRNGADFYTGGALNNRSGGTFEMSGRATVSVNVGLQEDAASTLIIDDSTLTVRNGDFIYCTANQTTDGGTTIFRGAAPAMVFSAAGTSVQPKANGNYVITLTFEVPQGGFATAPIRAANASKAFPNFYGGNTLKFEISPKSPCFEAVGTCDTALVDWRAGSGGVLTTGKNGFGALTDGGYFAYGTSKGDDWGWMDVAGFSSTAYAIGAHIVSAAHGTKLTVSGDAPVEGTEPAFGESEMDGAFTFSSPETYEANGVRYTCTGCTLTEIEKTADGSVRTVTEKTETSFDYTPCGKEVEAVWHYTADYRVAATAVNDANGFVDVSGDGYASATTPVTLTAGTASDDMEFQYWYGDLPYAQRYANPLTLSGDKARNVTAFFGRKEGGVCTASGSNGTVQWYDAKQWADKIIPGTNDTAVLWCTRTDTQTVKNNRHYTVPSFFAVKNLIVSNACVLVNAKADTGTSNGIKARRDDQGFTQCYCAPLADDVGRLEPVGCDIFGDLTLTYLDATKQNSGAVLAVGGQGAQGYSQVAVGGDLTVADGALMVAAGYRKPIFIDATKAIDGPAGFLPFDKPEEFFRGGNFVRVAGKTTIETPKSTGCPSEIHVMNDFRSGAAVWLDLQAVEIQPGAAITAHQGGYGKFDAAGLANGKNYTMCPGGHSTGDNKSGGSYGGFGGTENAVYPNKAATTHVATYGFETAPYHPGSPNGGDSGCGCRGAGSIRLDCTTLDLEGALLAQGIAGVSGGNKGGSSGGGIWVVCETFTAGDACRVYAQGGNSGGSNSGGGGGRVAICEGLTAEQIDELFTRDDHLATDVTISQLGDKLGARFSAAGGTGTTGYSDGFPGTGVFMVNSAGKTVLTVQGDPANLGEPVPGYGAQILEKGAVVELQGPGDAFVTDDLRSLRRCVGYVITAPDGTELAKSDKRTGSYEVTGDCTLTWKLTDLVHKLETSVSEGGAIETNAITSAGDVWQPDGSTVTLTAVPAAGRAFIGWCGELPHEWQTGATLSFPQTKGRSVKALFVTTAEGPAVWTGEGDGASWDDAANWDIGAVPGANSAVTIPAGADVTAAMCVPVEVASLTVEEGAKLAFAPNGAYSTRATPRVGEEAKETDRQPIALTVRGDLTVNGAFSVGGKYSLAAFDLAVGGNLTFGDGATGDFFAAYTASEDFLADPLSRYDTNEVSMLLAAAHAVGGRVEVGGTMLVATNAVVAPWCDFISGAAVRFDVGSLVVEKGGTIDAVGKGWGYVEYSGLTFSFSPTLRDLSVGCYAGGTYAGLGGDNQTPSATHTASRKIYGWAFAPVLPGSPGANTINAMGGGVVRVHARGTIRVAGSVLATGVAMGGSCGSGSGGGIFLTADRFRCSADSVISAAGGDHGEGSGGSGAGGRVAIGVRLSAAQVEELGATGALSGDNLRDTEAWDLAERPAPSYVRGTLSAKGGANAYSYGECRTVGEDGTLRWIQGPKSGLMLIVR